MAKLLTYMRLCPNFRLWINLFQEITGIKALWALIYYLVCARHWQCLIWTVFTGDFIINFKKHFTP